MEYEIYKTNNRKYKWGVRVPGMSADIYKTKRDATEALNWFKMKDEFIKKCMEHEVTQ